MPAAWDSRRENRSALAALLVGFLSLAGVAEAEGDVHVEFHDGMVTVSAGGVPMRELLEELSRQSGLLLELEGPGEEPITVELTDVSLAEALRQVLDGYSYVFQRGRSSLTTEAADSGLPSRLWVFSTQSSHGDPGAATATPCGGGGLDPLRLGKAGDCPGRLELALSHREAKMRRRAISELTEEGSAGSIEALAAAALTDDVAVVREEAIYGLGEIGGDAGLPFLEQALIDPQPRVREAAIDALADIGGDDSAWALVVSLSDEDPSLREQTVFALEGIGGEAAIVLLQQALADEHDFVRAAAAEALEELTD